MTNVNGTHNKYTQIEAWYSVLWNAANVRLGQFNNLPNTLPREVMGGGWVKSQNDWMQKISFAMTFQVHNTTKCTYTLFHHCNIKALFNSTRTLFSYLLYNIYIIRYINTHLFTIKKSYIPLL